MSYLSESRSFRRSLYGLPIKTRSTSISPSPAAPPLLFYQLYALNVLRRHSNGPVRSSGNTCRTTAASMRTNVSLSIQPTLTSSHSKENKKKQTCFLRYRYRCICIITLLLILLLITVFLLILISNFGTNFTSCNCPNGYERSLSTSSCTCLDRNECLNGAGFHTCTGLNMQCINTMGSYVCRCRPGFIRENHIDSCVDINECDLYQPCNTSISTCINLPGRYYCQCLTSQANDQQCVPRNICAEQHDLCGPHSECVVSSSNGYDCQVRKNSRNHQEINILPLLVPPGSHHASKWTMFQNK